MSGIDSSAKNKEINATYADACKFLKNANHTLTSSISSSMPMLYQSCWSSWVMSASKPNVWSFHRCTDANNVCIFLALIWICSSTHQHCIRHIWPDQTCCGWTSVIVVLNCSPAASFQLEAYLTRPNLLWGLQSWIDSFLCYAHLKKTGVDLSIKFKKFEVHIWAPFFSVAPFPLDS